MYQNVMYATDLLEGSHHFGVQAKQFAKQLSAELHLAHIVDIELVSQYAHLLGFAELLSPPLDVIADISLTLATELEINSNHCHVIKGSTVDTLISLTNQLSIDCLVIGHHEKSFLPDFSKNTATALLEQLNCNLHILKR